MTMKKSSWVSCKKKMMDIMMPGRSRSGSGSHSHSSWKMTDGEDSNTLIEERNRNSSCNPSKPMEEEKRRWPCPAGHVRVIVGKEGKQYFIPIAYLSHPGFKFLLDRTSQELGYHHCKEEEGLFVMCRPEIFDRLIHHSKKSHSIFDSGFFQDLVEQFNDVTQLYSDPQIIGWPYMYWRSNPLFRLHSFICIWSSNRFKLALQSAPVSICISSPFNYHG